MRYQVSQDNSANSFRKKVYAASGSIILSSLFTLGFCSRFSKDEIVSTFIKNNLSLVVLLLFICFACFYACFSIELGPQKSCTNKTITKLIDYKSWLLSSSIILLAKSPHNSIVLNSYICIHL